MRSIAFRAVSRIGVAVAALMLFLPSASAFTGGNGRIAFLSRFPGDGSGTDYEIVSIDRGGEDAIALTTDPSPDVSPEWSLDGRQILFESTRGSVSLEIYVMSPPGPPTDGGSPSAAASTRCRRS